jgi:prepilin-type N-terminal cleavage/methylation domain-containing protein
MWRLHRVRSRLRVGFTLLELLVVVTIIAVLTGVLLPAIQSARESARRTQCGSNLRQVGIALLNYETVCRGFPVGARSQETFGISWWVPILGHLEETRVAENFDYDGPHNGFVLLNSISQQLANGLVIETMACPSSLIPRQWQAGSALIMMPSYVGISGAASSADFPETRVNACCAPLQNGEISGGGILVPNRSVPTKWITDGLSRTMVVGECSDYAYDAAGNQRRIDAGYPNGWLTGTSAKGTPPEYCLAFAVPGFNMAPPSWNVATIRYPPNMKDYSQPGVHQTHGANNPLVSAHPGGVWILMADGAAQFINNDVDLRTFKSMATRDDGFVGGAP